MVTPLPGEPETILVVDDEPAVLLSTVRILEGHGYAVIAAQHPGDAIRLAQELGDRIDLLLTDVAMPWMNGHDLADTLCSSHPHIRHLFMSGRPPVDPGGRATRMDEAHFIAKPFTLADLTAKVREVLDRIG